MTQSGSTPAPLVSIICLSYNKGAYINEAVHSVFAHSAVPTELIVVDDASRDDTPLKLRALKEQYPQLQLILLEQNIGMCAAFNRGLALAKGKYVMDLAGDDALLPGSLKHLCARFEGLPPKVGVLHGDLLYVDAQSHVLGYHYRRTKLGKLIDRVPEGDVYHLLVRSNFVASAAMMMRRSVLLDIGGYDESLAYEDYDFKVRAGRRYQFAFIDRVVVQKRQVPEADSLKWYSRAGYRHLESTLRIGQKILAMNQTAQEQQGLAYSMRWHMRLSLYNGCRQLVPQFAEIIRLALGGLSLADRVVIAASYLPLPWPKLYAWWLKRRHKKEI